MSFKDYLKESITYIEQYKENEKMNNHSGNVVLMAQAVGTKEDLEQAERILADHERKGHLTQDLEDERTALTKKLSKKFKLFWHQPIKQ